MNEPRYRRPLGLLLAAALIAPVASAGCGGGPPANGSVASPVDPEQAAQQNKAMQDFLKPKMKIKTARK